MIVKKINVNIVERLRYYNLFVNVNKLVIVKNLVSKKTGDIMLEHVMLNFNKIINNPNLILLKNLEKD